MDLRGAYQRSPQAAGADVRGVQGVDETSRSGEGPAGLRGTWSWEVQGNRKGRKQSPGEGSWR